MKTLQDFITTQTTQSNIKESSFELGELDVKGSMKYGFMMYDDNSGTVIVFQFDNLSKYADRWGMTEKDFMNIDRLKVGESVYDKSATIYTRLW